MSSGVVGDIGIKVPLHVTFYCVGERHKLLNCRVIRLHYILRALGVLVEYFMRTAWWELFVLIRNERPHNAGSRLQFILPPPLTNPPHSFVSHISVLCYCYFVFCIIYTIHVSCTVVQAVFANYKQSCFIYYVLPQNNSFTFCPEDGGTIFPRNSGNIVSDRMVVKQEGQSLNLCRLENLRSYKTSTDVS